MNYIYLGLADLYLPATAAALHLKQLTCDTWSQYEHLVKIPYFRAICKEDEGALYHVGQTDHHDQIYITCVKEHPEIFVRGIQSLLGVYQIPLHEVTVISTTLENPQLGFWCSILTRLGLHNTANSLGSRVIRNRQQDLKALLNQVHQNQM